MTNSKNQEQLKGLNDYEVKIAREKYGKNILIPEKKQNFLLKILNIFKEPMFLLLIIAATIYFILGNPKDGSIMMIFVIGVISIDIIQQRKTDKTLASLKNLSAPHITVIRNGTKCSINSEDLVPGDLMIITEGIKIPADGKLISINDLCIDESSLTGESEGVWKYTSSLDDSDYFKKNHCYAGTLVTQGMGIAKITKTGTQTEYGKIGTNITNVKEKPTPLQNQTSKLIKECSYIAAFLFILVCIITYTNLSDLSLKSRLTESILSGITLAMAMIPEEFPVVLTVFLSMGAWRLAKKNSLVRKLPSVETLGAISVLCVDKTGTITKNKMAISDAWSINNNSNYLLKTMGMACETDPYDPMEQAMLKYCISNNIEKESLFNGKLLKEYSFTNEKKMMGHIWQKDNKIILCAKGSPEKIISLCNLDIESRDKIDSKLTCMASMGLRVIAVAEMILKSTDDIKDNLEDYSLNFLGLIGLLDPPRESIKDDILKCQKAGIRVVMITGDNGITAKSIASKIGLKNTDKIITGDMIENMNDQELIETIKNTNVFSRLIPSHKMRIINAFKENGDIVAMTGDGVNDAPALKYADIGIAMGKRGSEVSREASDLILLDDNFSTIVSTIKDGRRIYNNIKKAIGYIFTIHIPIAFSAVLCPILDISSSSLLLLPIHVMILELIIDPTSSIVLERQPAEEDIMLCKPRNTHESILSTNLLVKSIFQGIVLFISSFGAYYLSLKANPESPNIARSMGLSIIIISNLLLVYVNSSTHEPAYKSLIKLSKDKVMWIVCSFTILGLLLILYTPLSYILNLSPLSALELLTVILVSIISTMWFEIVKFIKKQKV